MKRVLGIVAAIAVLSAGVAAAAERGPVTNLPLPRFVSMKAAEGNARRGPSLSHRIDWVFQHRYMPLKIVAEYGNWRRVVDRDGAGGWMHYSLLSGVRTVRIEQDMTPMHKLADENAAVNARSEEGVIARLGACGPVWCKISADGEKGWVKRENIWGVLPGEIRN